MNKPATKEPSMDEILSSIRQIIADDDASVAPAPAPIKPAAVAPPPQPAPKPVPAPPLRPAAATPAAPAPAAAPLALSPTQMIPPTPKPAAPPPVADFSAMLAGLDESEPEVSDPMAAMLAGQAELLDPEDVSFEADPEPEAPPAPVARAPEPPPMARTPEPRPASRPAMSVAQAAPLPDPTLSSDMAEQLLAPATDAAVQGAMARLGNVAGLGIGGMTVEAMIRDMLKPMLKDWLDENLPALVERMVEKEIARISRGVK